MRPTPRAERHRAFACARRHPFENGCPCHHLSQAGHTHKLSEPLQECRRCRGIHIRACGSHAHGRQDTPPSCAPPCSASSAVARSSRRPSRSSRLRRHSACLRARMPRAADCRTTAAWCCRSRRRAARPRAAACRVAAARPRRQCHSQERPAACSVTAATHRDDASSNICTISCMRRSEARSLGDVPERLVCLGLAPRSRRALTVEACPWETANHSALNPGPSDVAFTSTPPPTNSDSSSASGGTRRSTASSSDVSPAGWWDMEMKKGRRGLRRTTAPIAFNPHRRGVGAESRCPDAAGGAQSLATTSTRARASLARRQVLAGCRAGRPAGKIRSIHLLERRAGPAAAAGAGRSRQQFHQPQISASVKLSSFSINPADHSRMHSVRSILQPPRGT
jgi:hypothetical protein